jgi:hypothetical protein
MNKTDSKFIVDSLIRMARTTTNDEKRENYIALAEEELDKVRKFGTKAETSLYYFFNDVCENSTSQKTERDIVYNRYKKYCNAYKYPCYTRNALYKYIRENGVSESRSGNRRYFNNLGLLDFENKVEESEV